MFIKFADWFVYGVLGLSSETSFGSALHFFVYDVLKILFLLTTIIFIISYLRDCIDNEKFKKFIEKQPKPVAYFLAALFGAVTPFCSCSSVPIFVGFVEAGLPFGVAMTFLITSPLISEIALLVLVSVIGIKITALYLVTGTLVGIAGGYFMEKMGFQKYLQDYLVKPKCPCATQQTCDNTKLTPKERLKDALHHTRDLVSKIWFFVIIGVGVGAGLHGYVPQEFFVKYLGAENLFAVPLAVIAAMPLYADATTIIPIAQVLIQKGAAIGTVLVFMMATIAISLPEAIILTRVMKKELLVRFLAFMFVAFVLIGYFYNLVV